MLRRTERILENIPVGSLGLISLTGCEELGKKVDDYLVDVYKRQALPRSSHPHDSLCENQASLRNPFCKYGRLKE